jgi:hypothetical protein
MYRLPMIDGKPIQSAFHEFPTSNVRPPQESKFCSGSTTTAAGACGKPSHPAPLNLSLAWLGC